MDQLRCTCRFLFRLGPEFELWLESESSWMVLRATWDLTSRRRRFVSTLSDGTTGTNLYTTFVILMLCQTSSESEFESGAISQSLGAGKCPSMKLIRSRREALPKLRKINGPREFTIMTPIDQLHELLLVSHDYQPPSLAFNPRHRRFPILYLVKAEYIVVLPCCLVEKPQFNLQAPIGLKIEHQRKTCTDAKYKTKTIFRNMDSLAVQRLNIYLPLITP